MTNSKQLQLDEYPRGSEWRKWDLHVHSKFSKESSAKLEIIDIFKKAIDNNIDVISITDHSNVDGLDDIWNIWETESYNNKPIKDQIEFLPGIEIRTNSGKHSVHSIVIFPKIFDQSKIDKQYLKENFLSPLGFTDANIKKEGGGNYSKGLFKITTSFKDLSKEAKKIDGLLIIHAGNKTNGIEKEMSHEKTKEPTKHEILNSLGTDKEKIMKDFIDICELPNWSKSNIKESDFYLEKFNKPSIISSDSHEKYSGKKFTWIKADPTFEGLKQIIYEPVSRVKIQKDNPIEEKQHWEISELEISDSDIDSLPDQKLKFNSNLVSIIGGRGSGKTVLLELISILSKCDSQAINYFLEDGKDLKLKFIFLDKNNNKREFKTKLSEYMSNCEELPIYYLTQDDIEKFSKSRSEVRSDFLGTLGITESDVYYESEINFAENIIANIKDLDNQELEIREKLEIDKIINKQDSISDIKNKLDNKIKILKSEKDKMSTEQSKKLISELSEIKIKGINLTKIKKSQLITRIGISVENINRLFDSYNSELGDLRKELKLSNIEKIDFNIIKKVIKDNDEILDINIKKLREEYGEKLMKLKKIGIKDIDSISKIIEKNDKKIIELNSIKNELDNIQNNRKNSFNKLVFIEKDETQGKDIDDSNDSLPKKYKDTIKDAKKDIDDKFDEFIKKSSGELFKKVFSGIEVSGKVYFNIPKFKKDLKQLFYSGKDKFVDSIFSNIKDYNDYFNIFNSDFLNSLEYNKDDIKSGNDEYYRLLEMLFVDWKNYIQVQPQIMLNNRELGGMSGGQEATLLLKLKLASEGILKDIILLDQPENHLDNKFINDELVKLIKNIKEEKQVIIASHNANVVVHSDSEEVIVANMDKDNDREYFSGSLENKLVLNSVVKILEGGKEALDNRIKKYNLK